MIKFKVGDLVRCIDASGMGYDETLQEGGVYKVRDVSEHGVCVGYDGGHWLTERFELVQSSNKGEVMHKFKVGDVAKIVGAEDGNLSKWDDTEGFSNTWIPAMDYNIGQTARIIEIDEFGIRLDTQEHFRYPPQALELCTELSEEKKYRTVIEHYPVRIICKGRKDSRLPWVVLYTASSGDEGVVSVSSEGFNCWGKKVIEEVPEIDWSKVAVDTPIWVKQHQDWSKQHFAKFNQERNTVCYWDERRTSHTAGHEFDYSSIHSNYVALTNPDEKA